MNILFDSVSTVVGTRRIPKPALVSPKKSPSVVIILSREYIKYFLVFLPRFSWWENTGFSRIGRLIHDFTSRIPSRAASEWENSNVMKIRSLGMSELFTAYKNAFSLTYWILLY